MSAELELALERRIGKRSAAVIEKHLGITTVEGLLNYYPRRYMSRGELTPIAELPLDEDVTLIARVLSSSTRQMQARRGTITDVIVSDDDGKQGLRLVGGRDYTGKVPGTLKISFFNGFKAKNELLQGRRALFSGRVTSFKGKLGLTNPDFQLLDEDPFSDSGKDPGKLAAMPIPVYPATAKLPSWKIQKVIATLLETSDLGSLPDPVPPEVAAREGFLPVADAYRLIHVPETAGDWKRARDRFRYQEALVLQSALARRRAQLAAEEATARRPVNDGILAAFDHALPFTLTAGQASVGKTLAAELAQDTPMNRLLQGEVGSGKTVVALRAMLQVVDAGGQAALLAPTEVLAAQHFDSIRRTLGPLSSDGLLGGLAAGDGPSVQVTLLTGSMPTAARKQAMLDAASGTAGIIIGTHALLSDNVSFYDLGLIVVDEQHRFGVEQRDALRAKARKPPHLLVMTATPIPRTVAMTVFGDLETSTLDELPKGRAPITTHLVGLAENPGWVARIWARAREEIDAGHQVYVVCPKIGTDDDGDFSPGEAAPSGMDTEETRELASVTAVVDHLQGEPSLAGVPLAPLHGRQDPDLKTETMAGFTANRIKLLVSTTVIEVGVDVHNATLMVILDADRFGISQLHQLRGRVGRGGLPGTCLLVTALEPGHPSRRRLDAVAATTDGFVLSQEDLKLRREGDILGASQSGGRSTLKLLRVLEHEDVIARARDDAQAIVGGDPLLSGHPELAGAIEKYLNPEKEAFLERG
ncbi:ATP-dependent DNA helicase RecG [Pseudarthrobacter niigatensis]|uniref:ATP-dependent DNA helicase RecG n=1 Tax=Pseudarthrobacter niigatensis TaxID=369935 RepID=A0AAJ1WEZ1_9MICC|nr:ATP-dependent DNA helicase RecG [Pseudarthrobacter niigatensis]MDQ0145140.1 ATP-dependent DNA helicase RecG [Pseudarthrobacter niigatensis]MDQ0264577.1 ATP-dependent DNA helicase RecG [Pseudarthrobacter niigatensis]